MVQKISEEFKELNFRLKRDSFPLQEPSVAVYVCVCVGKVVFESVRTVQYCHIVYVSRMIHLP